MFRNRSIMKTARRFSRIALLTPTPALLGWKSAHNFLVAIHNATIIERVSDALTLPPKSTKVYQTLVRKERKYPSRLILFRQSGILCPKGEPLMPVCFPPVADNNITRMIIGSMPGIASLNANQYYAHPRNAFWKIIARLFDADYPFQNYEDKLSLLLKNHIGLWDVFASCDRDGSLDSDIKNAVLNDFESFLKNHPKVTTLYFNGNTAYKNFTKSFQINMLQLYPLPSTSPANARLTFEEKIKAWEAIKTA